MKFIRINVKVLMILCLFSGILFLSTGCGENKKPEDNGTADQTENDTSEKDKDSEGSDSNNKENNDDSSSKKIDYSVWVANTTINTDKSQKSYKVIWGDTLWLISTAWDVSYQEIARFNNIPNPDLIYVDQIIYNPLFK